jgi:hypothetical protein
VSCDPPGSGQPYPCGQDALSSQIWTEKALRWRDDQLEERWTFTSDWKPPEIRTETMFQPALTERFLYVPGFGGSVFQVDRNDGQIRARIQPFGPVFDPTTFVWGGIAADRDDNIYYNVVRLDPANLRGDVLGAWLVKATKHGQISKVSYATLIPGAPAPTDLCYQTFRFASPRPARPWPPPPQPDGSPTLPPRVACGTLRPGMNVTPAISPDGTIFTVTHGQATTGGNFLVALRPSLTLAWAAPLAGLLNDGCGQLGECRPGATPGVDPDTNLPPEAQVIDASSSSPIALPDGGVIYGAYTGYNGGRGHLMKFDRHGAFTGSFDFGWDITPAVYEHDSTYSIILKDNHYLEDEYYITQINADLYIEWRYKASNPLTCVRQPGGAIECFDDWFHPNGFEWCVNGPVVDQRGNVYVTSGDGNLYALGQGGVELARRFLDRTRAASYTPAAMDRRGRIYAMNNGELYVLGE